MDTWHMGKEKRLQQVVLEKLDTLMPKKRKKLTTCHIPYTKKSVQTALMT